MEPHPAPFLVPYRRVPSPGRMTSGSARPAYPEMKEREKQAVQPANVTEPLNRPRLVQFRPPFLQAKQTLCVSSWPTARFDSLGPNFNLWGTHFPARPPTNEEGRTWPEATEYRRIYRFSLPRPGRGRRHSIACRRLATSCRTWMTPSAPVVDVVVVFFCARVMV